MKFFKEVWELDWQSRPIISLITTILGLSVAIALVCFLSWLLKETWNNLIFKSLWSNAPYFTFKDGFFLFLALWFIKPHQYSQKDK